MFDFVSKFLMFNPVSKFLVFVLKKLLKPYVERGLNFLEPYVKNLDASQLQIEISNGLNCYFLFDAFRYKQIL